MAVKKKKTKHMEKIFTALEMEKFFEALEEEIDRLGKTIANLCAKSEYKEAQYYRWKQDKTRIPKRAVLRFATALALFENEAKAAPPYDKLPGTDKIDYLINRLLSAAGYPATTAAGENLLWDRVQSDRQSWTLGYTDVSGWIESHDENWDEPQGKVVAYAEWVGGLLGLSTNWKYADSWPRLLGLLTTRAIDAIGPFVITSPQRLFDCWFTQQCAEKEVHISGVGTKELIESLQSLSLDEDASLDMIPRDKNIMVTYMKDEIGHTAARLLARLRPDIEPFEAANSYEAIGNVRNKSKGKTVCIFLSEKQTCEVIAKGDDALLPIGIPILDKLTAPVTFAFHRQEPDFLFVTNEAIKILSQLGKYVDTMGD